MSRYTSQAGHQEFVDALRACLGLAPIYGKKRSAEWWEAGMLDHLARRDGKAKKVAPL